MDRTEAGVLATPDDMLVDLARAGDPHAREELFRRHWEVAYRVAYRLLGHEQDALDAVQDGFLKAVAHLEDFDGRSKFGTWLLRVVSNAALDAGRKRRRRPVLRLADADLDALGDDAPDTAAGLHAADLRRTLDAALNRLTPPIRACFVLFAEAGLSYKEIADCQNIPLGTVMSRLHFARRKLQTYLEGIDVP